MNETIESGGLLASIDSIVQQTTIESGGELSIELATAQVTGTHIELGGKIDLGFLPFNSGTTSATINTSSDQLTVTDGGASFTLQLAGGYHKGHFTVAKDHGGTVVFYKYGPAPSQEERDNYPSAAGSTLPSAWTDLSSAAEMAQRGIGSEFNIEAKVATSAATLGGAASAVHAAMPEIMVHNGGFIESLPQPS